MKSQAPYLTPGRLANVLAAIQVMSSAERPERLIEDWAFEFDRNRDAETVKRWADVFSKHTEFFLTYTLDKDPRKKAALRLRYAYKVYDSQKGREYTPEEMHALPKEQRDLLTTKPLTGDQIGMLMNAAIELNARALAEQSAKRYWIPILTGAMGVAGAIVTFLIGAWIKSHNLAP